RRGEAGAGGRCTSSAGTLCRSSPSQNQDLRNIALVPSTTATSPAPRPASSRVPEPSFAEQVCLVLITQGSTHGWAIGTLLAPDGDVGRIWTLSRPLTYRAIDGLVDKRLVSRRGHVSGRAAERVVLAAT